MDFGEAEVLQDFGDFVVDGVDQVDPVGEGREPLPRQGQCFLVAVDADQVQVREALQHGLGVAAHAQGGVDDDGASRRGCVAASNPGANKLMHRSLRTGTWRSDVGFDWSGSVMPASFRGWADAWSAVAGCSVPLLDPDPHPRLSCVRLAPGK